MDRERHLIDLIRGKLPVADRGLRAGIGDDAAIIVVSKYDWVVTSDAFLEGVHFLANAHPAESVGYKSLARAASDIAAMGARPRFFLLNLALPSTLRPSWFRGFLSGMRRACHDCGLVLIGGDTTRQKRMAINITVMGEARAGQTVPRSGARPGDVLCVSGTLGEAALGLQMVMRGLQRQKRWHKLLARHLYPKPRIALGQRLAARANSWSLRSTAMIDVSDGLSTDLAHLCEASGVGARVTASQIPKVNVPQALQKLARGAPGFDPLALALDGGDDYELLFTVRRKNLRLLQRAVLDVPLTVIGEITRRKEIVLVDDAGRSKKLLAQGWDPFS